jgi:hypothetical protein
MFVISPAALGGNMVEITHGGNWIKWSSLSTRDRNWALLSFSAALLACIPIGLECGRWGYALGLRMGSGGRAADVTSPAELIGPGAYSLAMLAAAALAVISALAWWRFSRNQDEMFNRIQNYAIGQGSGWTFAVAFVWWVLSLGGWLGQLPLGGLVVFGTVLLIGFWYHGVHRWL